MVAEHKIRTLAHQLGEIISVYARSFEQWRENPSDVGRYERAHANLDLLKLLTEKTFPGGRGELGELLLCHSDFKIAVLRRHMARQGNKNVRDEIDVQLKALQARHDALIADLAAVCAQRSGQHAPVAPERRPVPPVRQAMSPPLADG